MFSVTPPHALSCEGTAVTSNEEVGAKASSRGNEKTTLTVLFLQDCLMGDGTSASPTIERSITFDDPSLTRQVTLQY